MIFSLFYGKCGETIFYNIFVGRRSNKKVSRNIYKKSAKGTCFSKRYSIFVV